MSRRTLYEATAIAKMGIAATAKIMGIMWGAAANATGALRATLLDVCRRYIEQVSKMLTLGGSGGNQLIVLSLK